jgi:YD repeat-containing protein
MNLHRLASWLCPLFLLAGDLASTASGPVIETVHWERRAGASGDALEDANAVKTWNRSWYDFAGKLRLTADYGTNNAANTFVTGSDLAAYPTWNGSGGYELWLRDLRESLCDAGAQVTRYDYDDAGHQQQVIRLVESRTPGEAIPARRQTAANLR